MSVLENFKNIPRSPSHRATGPKCNFFFFKFATKSLEKKKGACRPPSGDQWARPTSAAGGPVAPPPRATGVLHPYITPTLPFPPHLSPKIPPKIQEKIEE